MLLRSSSNSGSNLSLRGEGETGGKRLQNTTNHFTASAPGADSHVSTSLWLRVVEAAAFPLQTPVHRLLSHEVALRGPGPVGSLARGTEDSC